jgi:hypothetical protein
VEGICTDLFPVEHVRAGEPFTLTPREVERLKFVRDELGGKSYYLRMEPSEFEKLLKRHSAATKPKTTSGTAARPIEGEPAPACPADARPAAAVVPGKVRLKAQPIIDEIAIAEALTAKKYHLEAAFVRHFKGRQTSPWLDVIDAVCGHDVERAWETVKTWVNRVNNALLDLKPPCRLKFHTSQREHLVIKDTPPK